MPGARWLPQGQPFQGWSFDGVVYPPVLLSVEPPICEALIGYKWKRAIVCW